MSIPQSPFDGEEPDDGTPSYEWLDEWLCEYVDGTMDPSLEAVFEEYVEANPELKAHIERLRQTRELLCNCDLPTEPSTEAQAEVCNEVECDMLESSASLSDVASERPVATLGLASSVAVALVIGFLAGSMYVAPPPAPPVAESDAAGAEPSAAQATPPMQSSPSQFLEVQSFEHSSAVPLSASDSIGAASTLITTETP